MKSRRQVVLEHFNKYVGFTQQEKLLYKKTINGMSYFDYEPIFLPWDLRKDLYENRPEIEFLTRWTTSTLKMTCWCFTTMRVWV